MLYFGTRNASSKASSKASSLVYPRLVRLHAVAGVAGLAVVVHHHLTRSDDLMLAVLVQLHTSAHAS